MSRLGRIAGWINPVGLLLSPTFDREARAAGRRSLTYWTRSGYVVLLLAAMSLAFTARLTDAWGSPAGRLQALSGVAPTMALVVGWVQFFALWMAAPSLTAPAIIDERTKRTLSALATTPLTGAQIVFGKLAGRLTQMLVLALLSVPLLLAARIYGGLRTEPVIAMTALALATGALAGSLGMLFALWTRKPNSAGGLATLAVFVWFALPYAVGFALIRSGLTTQQADRMIEWFAPLSPPTAMLLIMMELLSGRVIVASQTAVWVGATLVTLALALVVTMLTSALFRRTMVAEAAGAPDTSERAVRRRARAQAGRRSRTVGDHPVFWRELRKPYIKGRATKVATALAIVGAAIALWKGFGLTPDQSSYHVTITVLIAIGHMFVSSQATTGSINTEREARSWETLLSTPLSAGSIARSKAVAAWARLLVVPGLLLAHDLAMAALGFVHWAKGPMVFTLLACYSWFFCAAGVAISATVRRPARASATGIAMIVGLWVALPMVTALATELLGGVFRTNEDRIVGAVLFINPVVWAGVVSDWSYELIQQDWRGWDSAYSETPWGALAGPRMLLLMLTSAAVAALAGVLAMALGARAVRRFGGRSS